ncbi:MAG TPA: helix-turn-helix transcriptional regulator [Solirubrobacteraceae bacterium]
MDAAREIRNARRRAGLTQAALAERAGTSQATLSAYESGRKEPSLRTLGRVLEAAGARLTVEQTLRRNAKILEDVLGLAEALPSRHSPTLEYPRLPV